MPTTHRQGEQEKSSLVLRQGLQCSLRLSSGASFTQSAVILTRPIPR